MDADAHRLAQFEAGGQAVLLRRRFWPWVMAASVILVVGLVSALLSIPFAAVVVVGIFGAMGGVCLWVEVQATAAPADAASSEPPQMDVSPDKPGNALVLGPAWAGARVVILTALGWVGGIGLLAAFGLPGLLVIAALALSSPPVLTRVWPLRGRRPASSSILRVPAKEPEVANTYGDNTDNRSETTPTNRAGTTSTGAAAGTCGSGVGALSEAELCRAWTRSFIELQAAGTVYAQGQIVALRTAVLVELEARDPAGFARWIASGARAASDPRRHLTSTLTQTRRQPPPSI